MAATAFDTINLGGDDDTLVSFDAVGDTVNCGWAWTPGFTSKPGVDTLNPDCETPGIDPAPNTTIASGPAEGAATNAPTYGLIASEGGVQFQVSADNGAFANCAATCQVPGLADGAHTLRFRAVETAGAQHPDPTPAQRAVVVDRRAPAVQIDSGPSGETTQTTATFGFSSDDAQATYQCSVDGAGFGPCGGANSHTASGLGLGAHTFEVRAADAAGNAASATRAFTVVPQAGPNPPAGDTTPPDTAIRKPKVKGKGAKLTFSSTEPGSTFTCKLDREKAAPCTSPQSYRKLKKGKHNVLVTATDAAGNADRAPRRRSSRSRSSGDPGYCSGSTPKKLVISHSPSVSAKVGFAAPEMPSALVPSTFSSAKSGERPEAKLARACLSANVSAQLGPPGTPAPSWKFASFGRARSSESPAQAASPAPVSTPLTNAAQTSSIAASALAGVATTSDFDVVESSPPQAESSAAAAIATARSARIR